MGKSQMTQMITTLICGLVLLVAPIVESLASDDGNWRRGRAYCRTTCTACHKEMTGESISPSSKAIAEWNTYFDEDSHDASGRTNSSLKYYVSREYRDTVKEKKRVVNKLIDLKDETLLQDVRAYMIHGASDSDQPATCQ
jgi:hypothetical protein